MKILTRLIVTTERVLGSVIAPVTLAVAFVLRRGRWSAWQRRQRRPAAR